MGLISRKLLKPRPQELGKIKIGGKGKLIERGEKSWRMPEKYDHFVVTTRVRDAKTENFIRDEKIHDKIGDKPTELHGVLMYAEPEENFHSEMCQYKGRTQKVSTCDGETVTNLGNGKKGPCLKSLDRECACKPYARLHLQLTAAGDMLGYHVFRTTSWESTNNIQTALEEVRRTFGTCYHAPVKLVLYPSEDVHDGSISTSHKVGLVLAMSMEEVAGHIAEARRYAELASGDMRQLAAGVQQELAQRDEEEAEIIAAEWFPQHDEQEAHAMEVENALAGDDEPEDVEAELVEEDDEEEQADDPHLEKLNRKYFAMLAERDIEAETDRRAFQVRLKKEGLVSSESCSDWSKQDYRSATAELDKIPVAEGAE